MESRAKSKSNQRFLVDQFCPCLFRLHKVLVYVLLGFTSMGEASQSQRCDSLFRAPIAQSKNANFKLNRAALFQKIQKSGVDLNELRVVLESGEGASVFLYYQGKIIGGGTLEYHENELAPGKIYMTLISLKDGFEGRGIGLIAYLGMAKAAYLNGRILQSNDNLTYLSEGIWKKMSQSKIAKEIKGEGYEFRLEVLQSPKFQTTVDEILEFFKLRPDEEFLEETNEIRKNKRDS